MKVSSSSCCDCYLLVPQIFLFLVTLLPNMTSPPHLLFPCQISDLTAVSRVGKKGKSPRGLWKFPQSHRPPWCCMFFPSELGKGNTREPAHFLPPAPGTDAITLGIHLHPFWNKSMDPHPFPLSLLRGACSGSRSEETLLSREEQAGWQWWGERWTSPPWSKGAHFCLGCYQAPSLQGRAELQVLTANLRRLVSRHFSALTGLLPRRRACILNSKHKLSVLSFLSYFQLHSGESARAVHVSYPWKWGITCCRLGNQN